MDREESPDNIGHHAVLRQVAVMLQQGRRKKPPISPRGLMVRVRRLGKSQPACVATRVAVPLVDCKTM